MHPTLYFAMGGLTGITVVVLMVVLIAIYAAVLGRPDADMAADSDHGFLPDPQCPEEREKPDATGVHLDRYGFDD